VSFFTELQSKNPFSVIWSTFIHGSQGYFLVSPLGKHFAFYNLDEQRNVWRYTLKLSESQRALIQDHLWELKHPKLTYFFHKHNCATLVLDILKLANPDLESSGWVSPVDVIKGVSEKHLVSSVEITPASKWKIKMLSEELSESSLDNVYNSLFQGFPWRPSSGKTGYLETELDIWGQSKNVSGSNCSKLRSKE